LKDDIITTKERKVLDKIKTNKKEVLIALICLIALFVVAVFYEKPVEKINTGKATLSWAKNTEPDLAGYKIYYGTTPRTGDCPPSGYTDNLDVGNVERHEFNNLEEGKTYYFSVSAYDSSKNESCFSSEMSKVLNNN